MLKLFEKFVDWLFDRMTGGGVRPNREPLRKAPFESPRSK